jgi:RNA polymerase sigma factor (sigma-70 family)
MHNPPATTGLTGFVRRIANENAPDADLLERFASSRDPAAFAVLVRRHGPAVWRVCRGLARQPADADDAYQATFLLLVRNAGKLRNPAAVGAWLYGTAVKVATKARNRRRPETLAVEPAVALDDLTVREAEAIFHAELATLPAKFRDPLVLCGLDGLTRDEAADRLGVSVAAVKHRLERGREVLKARLRRRGVAVSVPLLAGLLSPAAFATAPAVSVNAVSAAAGSLADEVSNMMRVKWKVAAAVGLAVVSVGGFGLTSAAPMKRDPVKPVKALPAEKRVTEIALGEHLIRATTSRDGKVLATVTQKGNDNAKPAVVTFWDTVTGKQLGTLGEIDNYNPLNIALSPDGSAFAWIHRETVQDNEVAIQVFDVKKGELRCTAGSVSVPFTGYPDLTFSPDGKQLAFAYTAQRPLARQPLVGGAMVADAGTGKAGHMLCGHPLDRGSCPVFADGGKLLATVGAADRKALLWSLENGQQERSFDLTDSTRVKTNAVTPDGKKLITFHDDGEIKVWDVETGKHDRTMADAGDEILHTGAVAVSADGKRVAAVVNPPNGKLKLKVWDVKSGKLLLTKGDVGPQTCCFDAAGRVAVCDGSLKKIVFHTVPE